MHKNNDEKVTLRPIKRSSRLRFWLITIPLCLVIAGAVLALNFIPTEREGIDPYPLANLGWPFGAYTFVSCQSGYFDALYDDAPQLGGIVGVHAWPLAGNTAVLVFSLIVVILVCRYLHRHNRIGRLHLSTTFVMMIALAILLGLNLHRHGPPNDWHSWGWPFECALETPVIDDPFADGPPKPPHWGPIRLSKYNLAGTAAIALSILGVIALVSESMICYRANRRSDLLAASASPAQDAG